MDSLDAFSATYLYYFFVFVVFSLRGNKVIITVISPELMSPVTRIMFTIQVQPFFDQECRQWKFSVVVVVVVVVAV